MESKKSFLEMIVEAIKADASRTGTSKQVIVKYLVDQFNVDPEKSKHYIKSALKRGLETGQLKMARESGKGANSYKLNQVKKPTTAKPKAAKEAKESGESKSPKKSPKKPVKAATKKPAAKQPAKKPKAPAASKKAGGSSTTPKKTLASKVKEANKPKKTPTKKIGKKATAASTKK
eukprot:TRINITY_DN1460_c0_g1_i1.p2 TRINITY_DN1460_c0_g1~~TRINITY_DN1460_c0_g1_i1.p2  ORF type:complete len:176 (-),score=70.83 TRINITY_DN1460_c0_g1_i1:15-542(-)